MSWCEELFLAGEAARAVWKPRLEWNGTVVVDAGICKFMTLDVTQCSVTLATILIYL